MARNGTNSVSVLRVWAIAGLQPLQRSSTDSISRLFDGRCEPRYRRLCITKHPIGGFAGSPPSYNLSAALGDATVHHKHMKYTEEVSLQDAEHEFPRFRRVSIFESHRDADPSGHQHGYRIKHAGSASRRSVVRPPMKCFEDALQAFVEMLDNEGLLD